MSQEITVTRVEDHWTMAFDGGSSYPVPENAIEKLDDDLTPETEGESVTFKGDYGGHKHAKNFDVGEVLDTPGDEDDEDEDADEETESTEEVSENVAEPTPEHVAEVGYNKAAGQAQQAEAQRLFGIGGGTQDLSPDSDFDFECPHCGADANDSTEKPYCSKECAEDDLDDVEVPA